MSEIVYVLTNECMPGLVKIGRTSTNVEQRMRELYTTGVPYPFECFFAARVENADFIEKKIHFAFGDHRVPTNKEFFRISPNRVSAILELVMIEEVTPQVVLEQSHEMIQFSERRPPFKFTIAEVPIGAVLQFARDENITCTVINDRKVKFRDEETSLSSSALELLKERGWKSNQVQGPNYWLYEGETLEERRLRIEEEK